jgi:hypothetical protein
MCDTDKAQPDRHISTATAPGDADGHSIADAYALIFKWLRFP